MFVPKVVPSGLSQDPPPGTAQKCNTEEGGQEAFLDASFDFERWREEQQIAAPPLKQEIPKTTKLVEAPAAAKQNCSLAIIHSSAIFGSSICALIGVLDVVSESSASLSAPLTQAFACLAMVFGVYRGLRALAEYSFKNPEHAFLSDGYGRGIGYTALASIFLGAVLRPLIIENHLVSALSVASLVLGISLIHRIRFGSFRAVDLEEREVGHT